MREADSYRANFSFNDQSVAFITHDASVISKLSALFDLPVKQHSPANHSIALREEAGGFAIHANRRSKHYSTLSGATVALAQAIPFMLLPFETGYVLHGGAFIANERAHLFLGPGYVGKSTIALEAWLMGYEVLGDDYILLDLSTATVQAVPKPLKLRRPDNILPKPLAKVIAPDSYCLGYAEDSWVLILSRGLPRMIPLHRKVPIGSIHLLERTDDNTSSCRLADKHQFLRSIYQQTVSAPRNNLDVLRCLSATFGEGRVFALHVGTNSADKAVAAMVASARGRDLRCGST